ncbi:hypothetical protein RR46_06210 [Papilio xuthus]|uniref:Uncharacterized protein n=1 Tax=Papilio xuthus TaxID=66420 RepID=A0A194QC57_PAPXU|nr:hypothetical protein RR46_06210 [Papilio xuthus]
MMNNSTIVVTGGNSGRARFNIIARIVPARPVIYHDHTEDRREVEAIPRLSKECAYRSPNLVLFPFPPFLKGKYGKWKWTFRMRGCMERENIFSFCASFQMSMDQFHMSMDNGHFVISAISGGRSLIYLLITICFVSALPSRSIQELEQQYLFKLPRPWRTPDIPSKFPRKGEYPCKDGICKTKTPCEDCQGPLPLDMGWDELKFNT